MRRATISRQTAETEITVTLDLDGTGRYDNKTGVGFFDHMLDQLARHALIDMTVRCTGDVHIDGSSTKVVATWHIKSHVAFARQQWAEQVDRRTNRLDQFRWCNRFQVATIG
mgnify:CR=1 FL=1